MHTPATPAPLAPKTPKGRATRARIVEAAATLIFEHGVAGTSIDDVGAAARVGKSQIYHYFSDKSALIGEVVARQSLAVLQAQQPHLSRLDSWESWHAWCAQLVDAQRKTGCAGGCPLGSIANEVPDTDEHTRITLVDSFHQWQNAYRDGIHRMQTAHLINADADADALAAAVLAAVQGGLLLSKTYRSTLPLEASLAAAIGYLRSCALAVQASPDV